MAAGVNLQDVRIEETLKIRIGEAKNLPSRKEPRNLRNIYCAVCLDQEEVFRTATIEKSLSPFFGDDIHFEVPKDFRSLCFYIRDADPFYRDTVIGKVAIRKEDLQKYHSDTWFPLVPIDHDSEVQGRIHIAVNQYEYIMSSNSTDIEDSETSSSSRSPKINVRIIQCSDLFACNGGGTFSDPCVSVFIQGPVSKSDTKRTKVRKRTLDPEFDESFTFGYNPDDLENCVLRCTVWSASLIGDVFLGQVRIPLSKCDLSTVHKGWYWLGPREERVNSTTKSDLSIGSLRLKVCYTEDHVFPSSYYDPLRETVLEVDGSEHVTSSAAHILGEIVTDKVSAARSLVRVFSHHEKVTIFIKSVVDHEVVNTTDSNTLFRGNSLVTKAIDEFMKLAGMQYLHDTLKCLIDEIFEDHKPCEIDRARLKEGESLDTNLANLLGYVERLFAAIVCSTTSCPTSMCQVFCNIRESAVKQFQDEPDVCYTAVSGFVFLRFFAPAILNPKLFQMRGEHPDPQTARTLTLASKAIQSLGNLVNPVMFGQVKEPYMESLKSLILDEAHLAAVKQYLDVISSIKRAQGLPTETPILLKEGILIKRAQGRRKIGLMNYKKRYFVLTDKGLSYAKDKGKIPLCNIPAADILAVEKLGEESFHMKLMFQVVQPERQLYMQANNSVDEREWIRALSKVCQGNPRKLPYYHPEAYICGRWLCCKEKSEKMRGCTPVTDAIERRIASHCNGVPNHLVPQPKCFNVVIDCDREIERIHSLILVNLEKLDELYCECECKLESLSEEEDVCTKELEERLQNITKLRKHVISLEQEHKQYRKITNRLTRHGSKKCPWGPSQEIPDPLKGHIHLR